jgi:ABC-type transport system involved in multi-copper enzyme maturation permease subunit
MLEMIRAELFKASRKKRTWMLIALSSLGSPLLQFISAAFVASRVLGTVADQGATVATTLEQIASPFNMARNTLAASSTLPFILLTLVAVFAVLLVGEERTFKMWKTILVANPNRMQVLAAKFLSAMILLFLVIFGGLLGSLLFGGLAMLLGYSKGAGGNWLELISIHALQWLALAAPLMMGFLIAWLNASPAIAVIGIVVAPNILEAIISGAILSQVERVSVLNAPFQAERIQELIQSVPRYFLTPNLAFGARLVGQAGRDLVGDGNSAVSSFLPTMNWNEIGWSMGVCGVYFVIFTALMVWSFGTRDVHE